MREVSGGTSWSHSTICACPIVTQEGSLLNLFSDSVMPAPHLCFENPLFAIKFPLYKSDAQLGPYFPWINPRLCACQARWVLCHGAIALLIILRWALTAWLRLAKNFLGGIDCPWICGPSTFASQSPRLQVGPSLFASVCTTSALEPTLILF